MTMASMMLLVLWTHVLRLATTSLSRVGRRTARGIRIASDNILGNEMLIVHNSLLY